MNCPNCNTFIKDGMKFCPKCGEKISQKKYCPKCNTEIQEGLKFCPHCGTSLNILQKQNNVINKSETNINTQQSDFSLSEEFEEEIKKEQRKSIIKWFSIIFVLLIFGYCWNVYNSLNDKSGDHKSSYSTYASSEEIKHSDELANAEEELDWAGKELNKVLPLCIHIVQQYGGNQMAYIAAVRNNEKLFEEFEVAEDRFERCFDKIIRIYEKMGQSESANAYRTQLNEWQTKIRKNVRGSSY